MIVKRVPIDIQDGAGQGYMNTGSLDGSRPSTYYINLKSTENWPKFTLPTLTYHETIPGHAWQGAYLTETGKLPLIRILLSGFNAYVEGYALYAEQLADEIGMYDDDWAGRLGYLQAQKFRAVRLVVDTGLHAKRWSREQAIQWAMDNSGRTREAMTSEIDRYCAHPRPGLRLQGRPHRDQPPARPRQGGPRREVRPARLQRPAGQDRRRAADRARRPGRPLHRQRRQEEPLRAGSAGAPAGPTGPPIASTTTWRPTPLRDPRQAV